MTDFDYLMDTDWRNKVIEFTFNIDIQNHTPIYMQLYNYLKSEIMSSRLTPNCRLPSLRSLSSHLSLGLNTVEAAYQQLLAEGYIISKPKSGYYVSDCFDTNYTVIPERSRGEIGDKSEDTEKKSFQYDFRYGQIDTTCFPFREWRRLVSQCIDPGQCELLEYGDRQGELFLRKEIAQYIRHVRGADCQSEQIIITSGTQQSLDLVCKLLKADYSEVAVEDPGYIGGRIIFKSNDLKITPIPLDGSGVALDSLEASAAQVVLISPSHQFPSGEVLPITKRLRLLKWAEKNNGIIIENDYEGEFGHHGRQIPCLQGLDKSGRVIYLYTFSSSFLPSIRISFIILPYKLLDKYRQELYALEQPVPKLQQKTLQLFMHNGSWERHVRKMKKLYKRKCVLITEAVSKYMGSDVEVIGNSAGLHILIKVKNGLSENELIKRANKLGVNVYPTSIYWLETREKKEALILLGFGGLEESKLDEGIKLLSRAWFQ